MKCIHRYLWIFPLIIFSVAITSGMACDLTVSMINQDPYPAIPGDYAKVVFQIEGVDNPECKKIYFELTEKYPLIFDPGQTNEIIINSVDYQKDFKSSLIAPYKIRVDNTALDGDNPIEVKYKYANNQNYELKEFNLNVKNNKANFEIYVKDYNLVTRQIILEILNTGKDDVRALTVEIKGQDNVQIKGPNTNIVGDLDSNEYTTADFEALPKQGNIKVTLHYTDPLGERKTVEESVNYDPTYFEGRIANKKKVSIWAYLFIAISLIFIIQFFYRRYKRKKKQKEQHRK